jgi:hypothetical protein
MTPVPFVLAVPSRSVDAGDLRLGDVLMLMDGRRAPIDGSRF